MFGKRGKYEAVPTEAAVKYKKKSAKANLLSAYFTSLLCLVLCATMFMSTSMAWFTSEVTNGGNEIYVGTLDVKLLHGDAEVGPYSDPVYDDSVVWAPDTLQIDEFTIENEGTLGFSYRMGMSISYDGYTEAEKELAQKAANEIAVWVKEGVSAAGTVAADLTKENGWTAIGTLADVLNGATIVTGKMDPVLSNVSASNEVVTSRTFAVALHMNENASVEIMGAKLSDMTIKLVAAQTASVNVVFTAQELQTALNVGGNVLLMNDITVDADDGLVAPVGVTTNLYLNGYSITGTGDEAAVTAVITNNGVLNIFDGTETGKIELLDAVVDANNGYATNAILNNGVLVVNGGTIQNNLSGASYAIDNNSGATATINGGNVVNTKGTAIRVYGWTADSASTLVVNGGTVTGAYAVRLHNLSSTVASKINVTVNDGALVATGSGEYNMALYSLCNDGANVTITLNGGIYYGDVAMGGGNKANTETFSWDSENCVVYGDVYSYNNEVGNIFVNDETHVLADSSEELVAAFSAATGSQTIHLVGDVNMGSKQITVPEGVNVTLDLAGHDVTADFSGEDGHTAIFNVKKGATLTINGDGDVHATAAKTLSYVSAIIVNDAGNVVVNGGNYSMTYGTYDEGYLLPTIIDTNSNVGKATTTINGGTFTHTRNMFRNFAQAQRGENNATLIINGGTFTGKADDFAAIWNQKTSSNGVEGDGIVIVNGGEFQYVEVDNEFETGVTIAEGVNLKIAD